MLHYLSPWDASQRYDARTNGDIADRMPKDGMYFLTEIMCLNRMKKKFLPLPRLFPLPLNFLTKILQILLKPVSNGNKILNKAPRPSHWSSRFNETPMGIKGFTPWLQVTTFKIYSWWITADAWRRIEPKKE